MDGLVSKVIEQECVTDCRTYSSLPEDLCNPALTHPREIRLKGTDLLTLQEARVYGAIQGMFNAKPDLAICVGDKLIVYEAKLTLGFDSVQLRRTEMIADVWASLLHEDLGFATAPRVEVRKLGRQRYAPDVSWESVYEIAEDIYPPGDRTRVALRSALALRV